MSPEQVRGQPVDARTDIFAFGVILYEMRTGEHPFRRETAADTTSAILKEDPPDLAADMPAGSPVLEAILRRCLEKRPDDRFQSVRDVGYALQSIATWPAEPITRRAATAPAVAAAAREVPSIAVLPFTDMSPLEDQDYFCEGMAEEIINALTKVEGLHVAARTSAFQFKGKAQDIRRIGEALNVKAVLEGSVRTAGTRLRVTAQLINVADGYHLWSERYDREMQDVFAIQDEIARNIVNTLSVALLGRPEPVLAPRQTSSAEAYHLYLKGRFYWYSRDQGGLQRAIAFFERAIEKDPKYAPGYSGLAISYGVLGLYGLLPPRVAFPRMKTAVERALSIDEGLAEAHAGRGWVQFWFEWDWKGWEAAIRRALEIDPVYVDAYGWFAYSLACKGRHSEALALITRALELDPLSAYPHTLTGMLFRMARQPDKAIEELQRVLEADPDLFVARIHLALCYLALSRYEEAVAQMEKMAALSARSPAYLGYLGLAYGAAGRREEALAVANELGLKSERDYVPPLSLVFVWIGLGDNERALEWLEKAYADRSALLATLNVDPVFDPLRSDPRFDGLLRRMSLASQ